MAKSVLIDAFTDTDLTLVSRLCVAIANNDSKTFDLLLPQIDDLDADNNRILRSCIDHDRFSMAKKLFLRGAASTILLAQLKGSSERAHRLYMDAPSSNDRKELQAYRDIKDVYDRLNTWKTTFEKDIMPILSMQKIEELQGQIAALRQEIADVISPARNVVKKQTPPSP